MMKHLTILWVLGAFLAMPAMAQKSKVTTGVLNLQQGKVDDAITKLEEAVSNPDALGKTPEKQSKPLAKAEYNLYKAYYIAARDTSGLQEKYPDALFKAKKYLDKALKGHSEKVSSVWEKQSLLDQSYYSLWAEFYNKGVTLFNNGDDKTALRYFEAADECNEDHFLTTRMLGSNYLMLGDTAKSVAALENCLTIFKNKYNPEQEGWEEVKQGQEYQLDESQLSYLYQQLAVIFEAQNNTEKALEVLNDGLEMLPDNEDLKRQELAIYQKHPDRFEQARKKFTSMLEKNPGDNNIRLAFASLLERNGNEDQAFELYEEAYKLDPESIQANYGIAAFHINRAAEISSEKMKYTKDEQIDEADAKIKQLCEKAYPYLVWLHKAQPNEPEWLSQLVNITPLIGKSEEMMTYAKKLRTLNSGNE